MDQTVQLVECPRDAMQGIHDFIPTQAKVRYINQLLRCGFHTLDCGSFVSPKAIPQMQDTAAVLDQLDTSSTRLSVIVANVRGAQDACMHDRVDLLGFPFSVSETFQQRNTNTGRIEALDRVKETKELCTKHGKGLIIYLSMAFGNPYGDDWNADIVAEWASQLSQVGADVLMPSDTIGSSTPESIAAVFEGLNGLTGAAVIGAHLHTTPDSWQPKLTAAWNSGVRRFDSAIKGFGGCPMAKDDLTGNMPTEKVLAFLHSVSAHTGINSKQFDEATKLAGLTFPI
jgi:hydroxymethylglutaryl-CoA lyase